MRQRLHRDTRVLPHPSSFHWPKAAPEGKPRMHAGQPPPACLTNDERTPALQTHATTQVGSGSLREPTTRCHEMRRRTFDSRRELWRDAARCTTLTLEPRLSFAAGRLRTGCLCAALDVFTFDGLSLLLSFVSSFFSGALSSSFFTFSSSEAWSGEPYFAAPSDTRILESWSARARFS